MYLKAFVIALLVALAALAGPPGDFPTRQKVEIKQGESVSRALVESYVIRSGTLFSLITRISGTAGDLKAGRYVFDKPLPIWNVFARVYRGEYGTHSKKVTIPEGSSNAQISKITGVDIGEQDQGYLFPDTYYLDEFSTATEIRQSMRANFDKKVGVISREDLVLASLVEEEASSTLDRKLIAGILEKRLALGMLLQVDVAPETYDKTGLPSLPIVNPGLEAINAVRSPEESKYLYYISDKNGVVRYARTFDEHKANRARYAI